MKKLSRKALVVALVPFLLLSAMGSRGKCLRAYAAEDGNEEDAEVVRDVDESVYENGVKKDVCFFIRGAGVGADIPEEPGDHPNTEYSSPIRIDGIAADDATVVDSGSQEAIGEDGFTVANGVTAKLDRVPTADEIKGVVGEFDPEQHYVIWYVIKAATTAKPNGDVNIHVDGVIWQREAVDKPADPEEPSPEEPGEPQPGEPEPGGPGPSDPPEDPKPNPEDPKPGPEKPEPTEPELSFMIETEASNSAIEYDGKEHIVGGFVIRIEDLKDGNDSFEKHYAPTKDPDTSEDGTTVSYKGKTFTVNVNGAYTAVKTAGKYEIPFRLGDKIVDPSDIVVKDSDGNAFGAEISVKGSNGSVKVNTRKVTITAGSTVKNDDGKTLTNNEFKITKGSLVNGHKLTDVVLNGSQTGVGSSVNEITSFRIVDGNGKDVTQYYSVTKENGRLVLVDGNNGSTDQNGNVTKGNGEGTPKSLGKTGTGQGTGVVRVTNVPQKLGAANEVSATPEVLGARRAATDDAAKDSAERLIIIFLALFAINKIVYDFKINTKKG
jgi:hypothetical protein